ncbi:hypothetical protein D3C80_1780190 [compost metagenome]
MPLSLYLTSFSATSRPMLACASAVEPPMCGVRITRSRPRSGLTNSSSLDLGSTGNTSMAAPIRCSSLIASARWSSSTTVPRAALIRMPPFLMARISFSPIIHWVDGSSGTCRETMSDMPSSSCRLPTWVALPSGSLVTVS